MGADGIFEDVVAGVKVVFLVEDLAVGIAGLPDFLLRREAVREASANVLHGFGKVCGREQQVDVVGHDDEGVEFVEALRAIALEGFEEELGGGVDLEEAATVVGDRGDEEGSGRGGSLRSGDGGSL
jgi:hypothetical protein